MKRSDLIPEDKAIYGPHYRSISVKGHFALADGHTVLECDLFADDYATDILCIDGAVIRKPMFSVSPVRECFSVPKTRTIELAPAVRYSGQKEIYFYAG